MSDDLNDQQQPYRPTIRTQNRYAAFKDDQQQSAEPSKKVTQAINRKNLFTVTITAATHNGGTMNIQPATEQKFLIDLVFKPVEPGLRLLPEEIQLLLSYLGEILKELEADEKDIIESANDQSA